MTSVTIGNSVTTIGESAFHGCSGLTSVNISDLVQWCAIEFGNTDANPLFYAHHLYLNGSEVTNLIIPNSVTSIGNSALSGCTSLRNVTIGAGVKEIGDETFANCEVLSDIKSYPNPAEVKMGSDVFKNVPQNVCKLHVLPQYLTAYKSTAQWMNFPHIEPMNDVINPDVSGDGVVGVDDMNIVINHILGGEDGFNGDINGDGEIDLSDLNMIINAILQK